MAEDEFTGRTTRAKALGVSCPTCGAPEKEPCWSTNTNRNVKRLKSMHPERHRAALSS